MYFCYIVTMKTKYSYKFTILHTHFLYSTLKFDTEVKLPKLPKLPTLARKFLWDVFCYYNNITG